MLETHAASNFLGVTIFEVLPSHLVKFAQLIAVNQNICEIFLNKQNGNYLCKFCENMGIQRELLHLPSPTSNTRTRRKRRGTDERRKFDYERAIM